MTEGTNIDVKVDDLVEVIFAARNADGTITEYTVAAESANDLRYIEEEFVGALNSNGIMHLNVIGQKLANEWAAGQQ